MELSDVQTGVKSLFSAYARVAYVMLIVFGSEVISRYSHDTCDVEFLSGNFIIRDNINYLLFASLFCYACGTMVFSTQSENETVQEFSQFLKLLSAILACTTVILTQFAIFVSHCEANDPKIDGDVDGLLTYSVILFTLMMAHAISNTTSVNIADEGSNLRLQKWFHLSNWLIRLLFVSFLVALLMHDRFDEESLNKKQQETLSCFNATSLGHEEFEWYKSISLSDFNTTKVGTKTIEKPHGRNEDMFIVICTVLGVIILEGIFKLISFANIPFPSLGSPWVWIIIGDVLSLFVDTSLALVLLSLTLANDIAACPMFDPWENRVRTVYTFAVVYIGFQFFMDMARFMDIEIVIINKAGNHMYEKFNMY